MLPIQGVQFHPESIRSEHGHQMLQNFLDIAAVRA
jgi:anthranilate synthase component 2